MANTDLFNAIYEACLYHLNIENLFLIQKKILKMSEGEILHRNYTLLLKNYPETSITKYVKKNLGQYIDIVLQICDGYILDDETAIIAILNNAMITAEQKHSYISVLQTSVTSIEEVEDTSLWAIMLDAQILLPSESNIIKYFSFAKKFDDHLISFINKSSVEFDFSKLNFEEKWMKLFLNNVASCSSLENLKFKQLIASLKCCYVNSQILNIPKVSNHKMQTLLNYNMIKISKKTLAVIRKKYSSQVINFILSNIEEYIKIMNRELLVQGELIKILISNISDEIKLKLLHLMDEKISIFKENFSPAVCLYILDNNLLESDIDYLFKNYETLDQTIQNKALDLAIERISVAIDDHQSFPTKLKQDLLHSELLGLDKKMDFLFL